MMMLRAKLLVDYSDWLLFTFLTIDWLFKSFINHKCQTFAGSNFSFVTSCCFFLSYVTGNWISLGLGLLVGQNKLKTSRVRKLSYFTIFWYFIDQTINQWKLLLDAALITFVNSYYYHANLSLPSAFSQILFSPSLCSFKGSWAEYKLKGSLLFEEHLECFLYVIIMMHKAKKEQKITGRII